LQESRPQKKLVEKGAFLKTHYLARVANIVSGVLVNEAREWQGGFGTRPYEHYHSKSEV